jgi:trk system potassium uptake protein TrkA
MNIIITGDGRVGTTLARGLLLEGHDVTLIDSSETLQDSTTQEYDVLVVKGNCAAMDTLMNAGVKEADLLVAATGKDEINLLCCTTAHGINPHLHTIARIRNPEYTDQIYALRHVFGLSMVINPERQAATEIDRLLKYPGFLRRDTFAKGKAEIVELRIDGKCKLCNVSMTALNNVIGCKVLVCGVLRNGHAIAPNGNFTLREGDRIFVTAPTENLTQLLKSMGIITRRARRVMLCGGDRISVYLTQMLEKDGISVQIIEQDEAKCEMLSAVLSKANVIHGDATDQALLESEGLGSCDALIALTGMDELNMIISLYGQTSGVPHVITKLGRIENRRLVDTLSLGSVVAPKDLCCNAIIRYVRAMQNQTGAAISVHTIADDQMEAVEFLVDENTLNCDIPLKRIKLKPNVLIACITHGAHTEIPAGNSRFTKGDTLVVVTNGRGLLQQLNDIFA